MPDIIKKLGVTRLILIAGVALSVIVFFVFLASRVSKPDMALLYKDLETNDAAAIVQMLEGQNVPYEIRDNGTQLFVPRDRVARLRMSAAEQGLPLGGSVGYEIFDKTDSLGTTNFVQNVNLLRALEGELSRTIGSLDQVDAARVHLVLPKREVFQRDNRKPSASIVIKTRGSLGGERVAAIQNLVAAAVPSLEPERVSVVDGRGNLLSRSLSDGANPLGSPSALQDIKLGHEQRIKYAVESLLEQTVGPGGVRAEVSVEIDHDRVTTQSETFDGENPVVRSTQSREETSSSTDGSNQDAVTVATNLPGQEFGAGGNQSSNEESLTEETVNYEISQKVTTQIREPGVIRRLSVAVLVDGSYQTDAEGNRAYTPRTEEELEQLARLVRSAVGFNDERGDSVEISNLRFAQVTNTFEEADVEPPFEIMGVGKDELLRIGETAMLGLIALLVMLLVVRPMMNRIMNSGNLDQADDALALAGAGGDLNAAISAAGRAGRGGSGGAIGSDGHDGQLALAGPDGVHGDDGDLPAIPGVKGRRRAIDLSHVEGNVEDTSLKKIAEIVERHPEEAVAILRNWLYQDR